MGIMKLPSGKAAVWDRGAEGSHFLPGDVGSQEQNAATRKKGERPRGPPGSVGLASLLLTLLQGRHTSAHRTAQPTREQCFSDPFFPAFLTFLPVAHHQLGKRWSGCVLEIRCLDRGRGGVLLY